jgi:hypothetical protein
MLDRSVSFGDNDSAPKIALRRPDVGDELRVGNLRTRSEDKSA